MPSVFTPIEKFRSLFDKQRRPTLFASLLEIVNIVRLLHAPDDIFTTAINDKFCDIFLHFWKKIRFDISCDMKSQISFVVFKEASKFEKVVC